MVSVCSSETPQNLFHIVAAHDNLTAGTAMPKGRATVHEVRTVEYFRSKSRNVLLNSIFLHLKKEEACYPETLTYPYLNARGPGWFSRYNDLLRAGQFGDRNPVGVRFSSPVQNGLGAHPASCTRCTGSFHGVK